MGRDEGLVHERVKAIVRSRIGDDLDPMRLVRLEGDAVARDPGGLADEAYAISMFGGSRAIWIDAQGRDLLPALEPLFVRPPTDCTIVIKAGQLKKGTGLRAAFESSGARRLDRMLFRRRRQRSHLSSMRKRAPPGLQLRRMRARRLSTWSAPTAERRAERSRNSCFMREDSRKSPPKMWKRLSQTQPRPISTKSSTTRCSETCPRSRPRYARFFHDGGEADYLMIRLIARLTLLHRLRLEMDQGRSFDAACQALFVKLPISARRALAKQAERWTTEFVAKRLPAVRLASARVRTEVRLAHVLATRALWTLASRRRGGSR